MAIAWAKKMSSDSIEHLPEKEDEVVTYIGRYSHAWYILQEKHKGSRHS